MVVATQNPIEMEGTYPLPEAQRDRFAGGSNGLPTPNSELDMLESHGSSDPLAAAGNRRLHHPRLIEAVKKVYVSPAVKHYIVQMVNATRNSRDLRLGASSRDPATACSRAFAAMSGRDYVTPDDVAALGVSVLAHRVLPSTDAQLARRTVTDVIAQAIPVRTHSRPEPACRVRGGCSPPGTVLRTDRPLVVLLAMAAGQRDVMRLGLLLVALPVIAAILVARARLRMSCERSIEPAQVPLGHR